MKYIRNWNDLEQYGINALTGEACRIGLRLLCDVNQVGKNALQQWFGAELTQGSMNNSVNGLPAVASVYISHGAYRDLAVYLMLTVGQAKMACVEGNGGCSVVGYFDTSEDVKFMVDFIDRYYYHDGGKTRTMQETSHAILAKYNEGKPENKQADPHYAEIDNENWNRCDLTQKYTWLRGFLASYEPKSLYGDTFRHYHFLQGQPGIGANATHAMSGRTIGENLTS